MDQGVQMDMAPASPGHQSNINRSEKIVLDFWRARSKMPMEEFEHGLLMRLVSDGDHENDSQIGMNIHLSKH
jgi:hypothetical protein